MRWLPLVVLFTMLSGTVFAEDQVRRTFDIKTSIPFRITLPEPWKQMTKAEVDALSEVSASVTTSGRKERYDAGFVLPSSSQTTIPLHILVQIAPGSNGTVITDDTVKEAVSSAESAFKEASRNACSATRKSVVNRIDIKVTRYDPLDHVLYSDLTIVSNTLSIRGCSAAKFTKRGVIGIHCSCEESEYAKNSQQFNEILQSVVVDPGLEVASAVPAKGGSTFSPSASWASPFLIVLFWYLIRLFRRLRQQDKTQTG